ncbi:uncharacterized protein BO97DRAFT_29552 [Aspergillus homomorphus CBS 101889]|uniref:WSC domain-containing protein n=1 Tax=Aspergillus homomorphus (strain CBS 101889) TaxID=1450537 RepID=A0A395I2M4_ASPHC|nr:hypothetical protein BO97DRAFT_29552 [Aspergillus homomorphus CBS 101889]RAL13939.1 hypothetical protein BO97DRAFT_29552 [Aspergillus homomorphus CBS 101889]
MKTFAYSVGALLPFVLSTHADYWQPVGCVSSIGNMENMGTFQFQSVDHCLVQCETPDAVFAAMQGESCYCGSASLDIQDIAFAYGDDACNVPCPGYARDTCGGDGVYSFWVSQNYLRSLDGYGDNDDDNDDYDSYNDSDGGDSDDYYDNADGTSNDDENEDGEDFYNWNSTSTAFATTTPSAIATTAVSMSASVTANSTIATSSVSETATGGAVTTTTSTSGASRRFRLLFF